MTFSPFSDLRNLLSGTPSYARWYELLALFFRWPKDDDRQVACDYTLGHLDDWPDRLRIVSPTILQQLFGELSTSQQEPLISEWIDDGLSTAPGHPLWHIARHLCWSGNPCISLDWFGQIDVTAFGHFDQKTQPFATRDGKMLLQVFQHITTLTIRNTGRARYEAPLSYARSFTELSKLQSLTMEGLSIPFIGGDVVRHMTSLRSLHFFNCEIQKAFLGNESEGLDCIEIMESSIDLLEVSPQIKAGQPTLHNCFVRECVQCRTSGQDAARDLYLASQEHQVPLSPWGIRAEQVLVSATGYTAGAQISDADTVVGRISHAAIRIDDGTMGRQHCAIRQEDEHFVIVDYHSANGTRVNGEFVTQARLNEGDRIEPGETILQWRERASVETGRRAPHLVSSTHVYPVVQLYETYLIPVTGDLFTLGRDPGNILRLNDASISRRHCHIEREGDDYYLQDGHSTGGTFLNGDRVDLHPLADASGRALLSHGDIIRCGSYAFTWEHLPTKETVASGDAPVFQILEGENQGAFVEIPMAPCSLDRPLRPTIEKYGTTASPRPRPKVFLVRYDRSYALQFEACYLEHSIFYNDTELTQHQLVMLHIGDVVSFHGAESCVWSIRWEGRPMARGCRWDETWYVL